MKQLVLLLVALLFLSGCATAPGYSPVHSHGPEILQPPVIQNYSSWEYQLIEAIFQALGAGLASGFIR